MTAEGWKRVKEIGSSILVAAACMDYRSGRPEVEQRELDAMKARVKELAEICGMKVMQ